MVVFTDRASVENYVSDKFFPILQSSTKVKFLPNINQSYGVLGSSCILDLAKEVNRSPNELAKEFIKLIDDPRFSVENGFLNFKDFKDPTWLLTKEEYIKVPKLNLMVIDDRKDLLCSFRLFLNTACCYFLATGKTPAFQTQYDYHLSTNEIVELLAQKEFSRESIPTLIWLAPNSLNSDLYKKIINSTLRKNHLLSFKVIPKVYGYNRIVSIDHSYIDRVFRNANVLPNAFYYYSFPYQASELDPESIFLNENANTYYFGQKILSKLNTFDLIDIQQLDLREFKNDNVSVLLLRTIKSLPWWYEQAVLCGEVYSFIYNLHNLLVETEKIINNPEFRYKIINNRLSRTEIFILTSIRANLGLFFKL